MLFCVGVLALGASQGRCAYYQFLGAEIGDFVPSAASPYAIKEFSA